MKKIIFEQFEQGLGSKNLGKSGWGFDVGDFRMVIYAPPEHDAPGDEDRRLKKQNQPKTKSARYLYGDHGPAHVHVIHKTNFRESRLHLVESQDGHHFGIYMPPSGDVALRNELHSEEWEKAKKIVDRYAAKLIQFWRERYRDSHLSGCVTRTQSVPIRGNEVREEMYWVHTLPPRKDDNGVKELNRPIKFTPIRGGHEHIVFDNQFDSLLPRDRQQLWR